jgi:hypothetical protein
LGCRQWKPWHAADELGKEKNNAELSAMPAILKQMLVSKKFMGPVKQINPLSI